MGRDGLGEGGVGGGEREGVRSRDRFRRKSALEHRTLDPVTHLHQGVRQREREVLARKVLRPLLKYVIRLPPVP
jgi:hypothetical protein